jgi:ADP-ribose pyrophosphatase YjhB (NUDIX family)
VVVRTDRGTTEVLVLTRDHGRIHHLPKGLVEGGESVESTAQREVREEGGVEAEIVAALPTIDYWFVWGPERTRYHKYVHFFLMRYRGGDVADHDHEVDEADWVTADRAMQMLSYRGERDSLARALDLIADEERAG